MHSQLKRLAGAHCQEEHPRVLERHGDNVLVIHDLPAGPFLKTLAWPVAGAIPVIAVLAALAIEHVAAVVMVIFVFFASAALMARRTHAEIDLADRKIRITREIFALTRQKVYPLDDYAIPEIQAKPRLIEGYSLPFFFLHLVGRGKPITLYSTDDPEEAKAVQKEIAGFLGKTGASTPQHQSG